MSQLPTSPPKSLSDADSVARLLDHALLNPTLTDAQMTEEMKSLRAYPLASVCIKPIAVPLAREVLAGTPIGVGTVIGFPHGSPLPAVKAFETKCAFADGAGEVDMVVNVGKVLGEDWMFVREDIRAVLDVTREHGGLLKVIFETDLLPEDRFKIKLCEICTELGADFVKTSTGYGFVKGADGRFGYVGATDHDLSLMRRHCGPNIGLKASGGIRTLEDVRRCVALGCTRLGTTSTHAILKSLQAPGTGEYARRNRV